MKKCSNFTECNGIKLVLNMVINKDNYDNSAITNLENDISRLLDEKYNDLFEFMGGSSEFIKFDTVNNTK